MSQQIKELLRELFEANPTQDAEIGHSVTQSGEAYEIFISPVIGGFNDIVKAHHALEHAGLIDNSRNPRVGDYGITTADGHITLGFNDRAGGFIDKAILSDNATALAKLGEGFSFEISFGNRNENDVAHQLSEAINDIAANRDKKLLEDGAEKRALAAAAKSDNRHEAIAAKLQNRADRSDAQDEQTVADYIRRQLEKAIPGIQIEISEPTPAYGYDILYSVKTQKRDFKITLPSEESQKLQAMSGEAKGEYMGRISDSLREDLPLTRPEFAKINGIGEVTLFGSVVGGSAKLAAEITGELQEHIDTQRADGKSWAASLGDRTGRSRN